MGNINQIILSANEDPLYIDFWKPVAWAYKMIFPDVKVHLAFLTNRSEDDPYVQRLRESGTVTLFKPVDNIPEFGQAKMIRFILASQQGDDVCYIDDIDLFPLVKSFITDKTNSRPQGQMLCVGGEVYHNNGCYPVSQMTAEGWLWKKLINPKNYEYSKLINTFRNPPRFDKRENISIKLDWAKDMYFSDERLIRRLRHENPIPVFEMERGYKHYMDSTIDRAKWEVDIEKLKSHGYFNAHGVRPFNDHKEKYEPLVKYILENY